MKTSYSLLERYLAKKLKSTPRIKKLTKQCYQFIMLILHKKTYKKNTVCKLTPYTGGNETFFGYYDKTPINSNERYILYHSTGCTTKHKPDPSKPVEIIVQDPKSDEIVLRIPSFAYNWQQGCRTQWLDADHFIFNDFDVSHKKYISRVWSVSNLKEKQVFDYPVQDAYYTDYFLSLNYQRLMTLRPDYGYSNLPGLNKTELSNTDQDGIWKIDYRTGKGVLLVSLTAMSAVQPNKHMKDAIHKVNHVMISPSGKQFIFLHRYYIGKRRIDRLLLADSTTAKLSLLADYGMISHCFWADNKTILSYFRGPDKKDAYRLIDTETGIFTMVVDERLEQYGDGHPHVHGDWFVTDTYPDKARMQHLILANRKTREVKELGEFFHGLQYSGETRCDLHPRFSPDGRAVFFDSVFSGKRQFYRMDISETKK
jgi:hypothetical protein